MHFVSKKWLKNLHKQKSLWPVPLSVPTGRLRPSVFLLFTNCHSFINTANFNMIFSRNLPWGIVIPIHTVKCTKLIILYAFLTSLLMFRFPLGNFCLFLGLGWCLRSADALDPCNWPVFFWGIENLVDLGTLKKKSTKSDHVYYTLKIFENFMFLEDENVPLVLGGLRRLKG
jgi:hypothetical protein